MARLEIFWTRTALQQRNYVFQYWNERNKSQTYSRKLNAKIKKRISLLKANPELGKKVEHQESRVLSLGHYSIFYSLVGSKIIIIAFWDNRQDPKILLKVLKRK